MPFNRCFVRSSGLVFRFALMTGQATVLIDGGYFDNINDYSRSEHSSAIDIHDFATELCAEFDYTLLRAKFYHAMPYIDEDDPNSEEQRRKAQSFFDTIDNIQQVQFEEKGRVKLEHTNCPDCSSHFTFPSQKGVDVGIAVDLVEMAADPNSPSAYILVSGDEDLKHAVRAAKDNHANVFLGYAYDRSYDLYSAEALRQEVDHQMNVVDGLVSSATMD